MSCRRLNTEVVDPDNAEVDGEASGLFRSAMRLLREDLARNDPDVARATAVAWDVMEVMSVCVHHDLRVRVRNPRGRDVQETVEVDADRKITQRKWARGSGPGPGVVAGAGQWRCGSGGRGVMVMGWPE